MAHRKTGCSQKDEASRSKSFHTICTIYKIIAKKKLQQSASKYRALARLTILTIICTKKKHINKFVPFKRNISETRHSVWIKKIYKIEVNLQSVPEKVSNRKEHRGGRSTQFVT